MNEVEHLKHAAAARALEYVCGGMRIGLGSGTTAEAFLELLGARVRGGLDIVGVPTSERTAQLARARGIALASLNDVAPLDLAIDGADESDRRLDLIKGGGGALLREKVVASASKRMIVIIHGSKLVECLGAFPLPVEVMEFGHVVTATHLSASITALGYPHVPVTLRRRADGGAFKTDNGNVIYDCGFGAIHDAALLSRVLSAITGVVEHGLYVGIARTLVIARPEGIEVIERAG
jgi:ribose 5-phosphate isomerase A